MMLYLLSVGLLLALLAPAPEAHAARLQEKLNGKLQEQQVRAKRIERELRSKRQALERVGRREKDTAAELRALEQELAVRKLRLAELERQCQACEADYGRAKAELAVLLPQVGQLRESLGQGLVVLADLEPNSDCAALFGPEHPSRAAETALYLERLARAEASAIGVRLSDAERLKQSQERLEREHNRLLDLRAQVAGEQAAVARQQAQKARLLASLGREKQSYTRATRQLESSRQAIRRLIDELEDKLAAAEREAARKQAAKPGEPLRPAPPGPPPLPGTGFAAWKGRLSPPVAGRVLATFGQRDAQGIACTGVDIEAADGAAIGCVWRGRVAYAGMLKGYGNMVIVDHGEGYYTLYGRAGRLTKAQGQTVERGETLGTVAGGQGLYFEIRHHRAPQNPLAWLAGTQAANTRLE